MAHIHSIYDTDKHFVIDGVKRTITNEVDVKNLIVQHDHNSERFTFELPRYIDGHDMSTCNIVEVHYINISSANGDRAHGVYRCDDLQVSPDSDDVVICSWLISGNATRFVGNLSFVVRFVCSVDGELDYAWNTTTFTPVNVATGIYNGNAVAEKYADVLAEWEARIAALEKGGVTEDQIADAVETALVEAKESGQFDGNPGEPGVPGKSAYEVALDNQFVGSEEEWLASLHGKPGADGKTPVKGEDYFTDADKQEMVAAVLEELPETSVATEIDLSAYESEGKIVETFADGTSKITTVEFDADGNPVKITDGDGNVTTLTW